ncbi:PAS domain-containing protein [Accumulibacter sp.]|jgi:PAS domain S-box-containing protein|uniref:Putative PAS/PAC sensor protein n=1 Tax=Accumulibacter regalis TaxID=522306 RepID=C7RJ96_ACCRE|nr:PAS domain-containing protein [Accumulibacter sp.]MBN8497611.1 PAS domain-containing protein [Accumulibacter sp.]MBO3716656.1 PAS domain-containing protein [Accumulibacter sp.]
MASATASRADREAQLLDGLDAASPWAAVFENTGLAVAVLNADFVFLRVNSRYAAANDQAPEFFPGRNYFEIFPQTTVEAIFRRVRDSGIAQAVTRRPGTADLGATGEIGACCWSLTPFADDTPTRTTRYLVLTIPLLGGVPAAANAAHPAAADRDPAETALHAGERRFRGLFESLTAGFALHEIVLDADGQACDYRFLEVNPAFEAITGLTRSAILGRCARTLLQPPDSRWLARYANVALTGDCAQFDDFSNDLGRHYRITVYCPEPGQFAVLYDDVTTITRPAPAEPVAEPLAEPVVEPSPGSAA